MRRGAVHDALFGAAVAPVDHHHHVVAVGVDGGGPEHNLKAHLLDDAHEVEVRRLVLGGGREAHHHVGAGLATAAVGDGHGDGVVAVHVVAVAVLGHAAAHGARLAAVAPLHGVGQIVAVGVDGRGTKHDVEAVLAEHTRGLDGRGVVGRRLGEVHHHAGLGGAFVAVVHGDDHVVGAVQARGEAVLRHATLHHGGLAAVTPVEGVGQHVAVGVHRRERQHRCEALLADDARAFKRRRRVLGRGREVQVDGGFGRAFTAIGGGDGDLVGLEDLVGVGVLGDATLHVGGLAAIAPVDHVADGIAVGINRVGVDHDVEAVLGDDARELEDRVLVGRGCLKLHQGLARAFAPTAVGGRHGDDVPLVDPLGVHVDAEAATHLHRRAVVAPVHGEGDVVAVGIGARGGQHHLKAVLAEDAQISDGGVAVGRRLGEVDLHLAAVAAAPAVFDQHAHVVGAVDLVGEGVERQVALQAIADAVAPLDGEGQGILIGIHRADAQQHLKAGLADDARHLDTGRVVLGGCLEAHVQIGGGLAAAAVLRGDADGVRAEHVLGVGVLGDAALQLGRLAAVAPVHGVVDLIAVGVHRAVADGHREAVGGEHVVALERRRGVAQVVAAVPVAAVAVGVLHLAGEADLVGARGHAEVVVALCAAGDLDHAVSAEVEPVRHGGVVGGGFVVEGVGHRVGVVGDAQRGGVLLTTGHQREAKLGLVVAAVDVEAVVAVHVDLVGHVVVARIAGFNGGGHHVVRVGDGVHHQAVPAVAQVLDVAVAHHRRLRHELQREVVDDRRRVGHVDPDDRLAAEAAEVGHGDLNAVHARAIRLGQVGERGAHVFFVAPELGGQLDAAAALDELVLEAQAQHPFGVPGATQVDVDAVEAVGHVGVAVLAVLVAGADVDGGRLAVDHDLHRGGAVAALRAVDLFGVEALAVPLAVVADAHGHAKQLALAELHVLVGHEGHDAVGAVLARVVVVAVEVEVEVNRGDPVDDATGGAFVAGEDLVIGVDVEALAAIKEDASADVASVERVGPVGVGHDAGLVVEQAELDLHGVLVEDPATLGVTGAQGGGVALHLAPVQVRVVGVDERLSLIGGAEVPQGLVIGRLGRRRCALHLPAEAGEGDLGVLDVAPAVIEGDRHAGAGQLGISAGEGHGLEPALDDLHRDGGLAVGARAVHVAGVVGVAAHRVKAGDQEVRELVVPVGTVGVVANLGGEGAHALGGGVHVVEASAGVVVALRRVEQAANVGVVWVVGLVLGPAVAHQAVARQAGLPAVVVAAPMVAVGVELVALGGLVPRVGVRARLALQDAKRLGRPAVGGGVGAGLVAAVVPPAIGGLAVGHRVGEVLRDVPQGAACRGADGRLVVHVAELRDGLNPGSGGVAVAVAAAPTQEQRLPVDAVVVDVAVAVVERRFVVGVRHLRQEEVNPTLGHVAVVGVIRATGAEAVPAAQERVERVAGGQLGVGAVGAPAAARVT